MSWPGGAECAITLSFDDAYEDTVLSVAHSLDEYGVKATYNVIVGLVGGRFVGFKLANWNSLRDLSLTRNEIASHGLFHAFLASGTSARARKLLRSFLNQPRETIRIVFKHKFPGSNYEAETKKIDVLYELTSSKEEIEKNIPNYECTSFVYPGGNYDNKLKLLVKNVGYLSARSLDPGYNDPRALDFYALKVKMWDYATKVEKANKWVDKVCEKAGWLIECFHLVGDDGTGYPYFTKTDVFKRHLDYLAERNVWVAPQGDVVKYLVKRGVTSKR